MCTTSLLLFTFITSSFILSAVKQTLHTRWFDVEFGCASIHLENESLGCAAFCAGHANLLQVHIPFFLGTGFNPMQLRHFRLCKSHCRSEKWLWSNGSSQTVHSRSVGFNVPSELETHRLHFLASSFRRCHILFEKICQILWKLLLTYRTNFKFTISLCT